MIFSYETESGLKRLIDEAERKLSMLCYKTLHCGGINKAIAKEEIALVKARLNNLYFEKSQRNKMNKQTAMKYKNHIEAKLKAENVDKFDCSHSITTLNKCVQGDKLVEAYLVLMNSSFKGGK